MVAATIGALSAVMLFASAGVATAQPSRAVSASDARGCCVCRGTAGGNATAVRSCSDGVSVDACTSQCKNQNADSLAFGYQKTCSQGCAGFPTQSLR